MKVRILELNKYSAIAYTPFFTFSNDFIMI